jgi:hypothetical protein
LLSRLGWFVVALLFKLFCGFADKGSGLSQNDNLSLSAARRLPSPAFQRYLIVLLLETAKTGLGLMSKHSCDCIRDSPGRDFRQDEVLQGFLRAGRLIFSDFFVGWR